MFNFVLMFFICTWLPDWTFDQYLAMVLQTTIQSIQHLLDGASSIAIIAAFFFAIVFKDRIAQLFGFDHKTLFRFKLRDCLTCFGSSRFQPIELDIWKVEDLRSDDPFTANNVFVEFYLGYNETMATRVFNNAGSGCLMKQVLQLNFDENDEEETLFIFVRNQKVVGTSELARAEIPTEKLKAMVNSTRGPVIWSPLQFPEAINMIPRGKLWLRAARVDDADYNQSFFNELTTC
eukprot:CAMPEP_0170261620 /NCGR_PEP_ID=MMETSP0116_2-20130129/30691_1 /TAXON_ID=400756 /ORGANISM="Durinskia baltica, Strain CSIRO CS-38" /LENGTH=233 /DNA_ID=CAMNT_0010512685 /DNA_START=182 /DNA_END=883 /DNA_ORIENTATION=+